MKYKHKLQHLCGLWVSKSPEVRIRLNVCIFSTETGDITQLVLDIWLNYINYGHKPCHPTPKTDSFLLGYLNPKLSDIDAGYFLQGQTATPASVLRKIQIGFLSLEDIN